MTTIISAKHSRDNQQVQIIESEDCHEYNLVSPGLIITIPVSPQGAQKAWELIRALIDTAMAIEDVCGLTLERTVEPYCEANAPFADSALKVSEREVIAPQ